MASSSHEISSITHMPGAVKANQVFVKEADHNLAKYLTYVTDGSSNIYYPLPDFSVLHYGQDITCSGSLAYYTTTSNASAASPTSGRWQSVATFSTATGSTTPAGQRYLRPKVIAEAVNLVLGYGTAIVVVGSSTASIGGHTGSIELPGNASTDAANSALTVATAKVLGTVPTACRLISDSSTATTYRIQILIPDPANVGIWSQFASPVLSASNPPTLSKVLICDLHWKGCVISGNDVL